MGLPRPISPYSLNSPPKGGEEVLFSKASFHTKVATVSPIPQELRVFIDEPYAIHQMGSLLATLLKELNPRGIRQPVVLAIGTDRSTGDSLGPLVGSRLSEFSANSFPIYGTLEEPIHAVNLRETLRVIQEEVPHPLIIAVDACLGQLKNVGSVNMGRGSLTPGTGVNKVLPPVGEIYFSGIVNIGGYLEYLVLQNTRLSQVVKMADCIAHSLLRGKMIADRD